MKFKLEAKSLETLEEEVSYLVKNYLDSDTTDSILLSILEDYYKRSLDVKDIYNLIPYNEERIVVYTKFKRDLINRICENRGADCYEFLDKMSPYIDKGRI